MRFVVLAFVLFFMACSNEQEHKKSLGDANESVQIESADEKSEVNDTNVPLPVEESSLKNETMNTQDIKVLQADLDDARELYKSKCAICHGKEGERQALSASLIIKDMSQKDFVESLKGYQAGNYGRHLALKMKPYADILTFSQMSALAKLIVKNH